MPNTTCIILAGGQSSRMGADKSFLRIDENFIISKLVELVKPLFNDLIIIANNLKAYSNINVKVFEDVYRDCGPLGGIHSGLLNSNTNKNFIISCDMPLMDRSVLEYICSFDWDGEILVPKVDEKIHPLCGLYSKNLTQQLEHLLDASKVENNSANLSVYSFIKKNIHRFIEMKKWSNFREECFLNMNTRDDYKKVLRFLEQ